MLKPAQSYFTRMPEEKSIQCANEIYEDLLANASGDQIEAVCGLLVSSRGEPALAIDPKFPELKALELDVTGHKGFGNRYQFVFIHTKTNKNSKFDQTLIVDARDLRKFDPVRTLEGIDPETLRWFYLIAGKQLA